MKDSVTLLIKHHVQSAAIPAYEEWLKQISIAGQTFKGHQGVSIIRPHGNNAPYSILLRFDTHDNLLAWIESPTRKTLLEQAQQWLATVESTEIETGLEYWFTPSDVVPLRAKPYKQFLITLSAIYPLTIVIPWLLSPIMHSATMQNWPLANGLLNVIVIVYLMVYVVMPRYTRSVAGWLFR